MRRLDWLLVCIVILSSLSYGANLGRLVTVFRVLTLGVYGVIFLAYLTKEGQVLEQQRFMWYTLGSIWILYLLHLLVPPTPSELYVRVLMFISVSALNFIVIPRLFSPPVFLRSVSHIGAAVVIVGVPATIIGSFAIGPLHIQAANGSFSLFPFGPDISVHPMMSYYRNQNFASVTVLAGLIGSLYEFERKRYRYGAALFAINGLGLWLCHARSTILAGIVGLGLYVIYRLGGPQLLQIGMVTGVPLAIIGFLMTFFKIGPEPLTSIDLTGRRRIWAAAASAIIDRPLIGWGPIVLQPIIDQYITGFKVKPPHNSYLLMTMRLGILGGIAHAGMVILSLWSHLRSLPATGTIVGLSLAVSLSVVMLFQNFVLFGLNASSVIGSIALGYAAYDIIPQWKHRQMS